MITAVTDAISTIPMTKFPTPPNYNTILRGAITVGWDTVGKQHSFNYINTSLNTGTVWKRYTEKILFF